MNSLVQATGVAQPNDLNAQSFIRSPPRNCEPTYASNIPTYQYKKHSTLPISSAASTSSDNRYSNDSTLDPQQAYYNRISGRGTIQRGPTSQEEQYENGRHADQSDGQIRDDQGEFLQQ